MSTAILLDNLTLGYERHPAVHHLTGEFEAGSLTAVIGPNGAGKSTLLKGIIGALAPLTGSIDVRDCSRQDIAYLPQQAEIDRSFPINVLDMVALGHWKRVGLFGAISRALLEQTHNALIAVGLAGFEKRPIGTLSGGQLQRALFARMLLQDAKVLLLDEPFTAIDARTTADLLELIHRWHTERRIIVVVLHDLDIVREHFPRSLLLARELLAWGPTRDVLTAQNLLRARRLCEAWDDRAAVCAEP